MRKNILDFFKRRLPSRNEIFLALSMAAFLVFGWSLITLFNSIPAYLLSYGIGDILSIAAYMLGFALLEIVVVIAALMIVAVILPGAVLKDGFAYKASFFLIAFGVIFAHLQFVMTNQPKIPYLLLQLGYGLALWLIPVLLTRYFPVVRKVVLDVLDRMTIFSYIYLPLGILSVFVVILRNLW